MRSEFVSEVRAPVPIPTTGPARALARISAADRSGGATAHNQRQLTDAIDVDNDLSSATDQLAYNRSFANEAHSLGLAAALKNDLDQSAALGKGL